MHRQQILPSDRKPFKIKKKTSKKSVNTDSTTKLHERPTQAFRPLSSGIAFIWSPGRFPFLSLLQENLHVRVPTCSNLMHDTTWQNKKYQQQPAAAHSQQACTAAHNQVQFSQLATWRYNSTCIHPAVSCCTVNTWRRFIQQASVRRAAGEHIDWCNIQLQ